MSKRSIGRIELSDHEWWSLYSLVETYGPAALYKEMRRREADMHGWCTLSEWADTQRGLERFRGVEGAFGQDEHPRWPGQLVVLQRETKPSRRWLITIGDLIVCTFSSVGVLDFAFVNAVLEAVVFKEGTMILPEGYELKHPSGSLKVALQ